MAVKKKYMNVKKDPHQYPQEKIEQLNNIKPDFTVEFLATVLGTACCLLGMTL